MTDHNDATVSVQSATEEAAGRQSWQTPTAKAVEVPVITKNGVGPMPSLDGINCFS